MAGARKFFLGFSLEELPRQIVKFCFFYLDLSFVSASDCSVFLMFFFTQSLYLLFGSPLFGNIRFNILTNMLRFSFLLMCQIEAICLLSLCRPAFWHICCSWYTLVMLHFSLENIYRLFNSNVTQNVLPPGTSKCAKNRNGCPEICLSSSNDVPTCVCHDFSVYAKENNSCVVVINRSK